MGHLRKCIEVISGPNGFHSEWISDFTLTPHTYNTQFATILSRANSCIRDFYYNLNYSVLRGEYLDVSRVQEDLDELLRLIETIPQPLVILEGMDSFRDQLSNILLFQFVNPLKSSVREYRSFISILKRNLKIDDFSVIFEISSFNQSFFIQSDHFPILLDTQNNSAIFQKNIRVAVIDHNLSVRKEFLSELYLIKKDLEKISSNDIFIRVLIEKSSYLFKKILYRFQEDSKNYLYAYEFEEIELNPDEINLTIFKEFDEITIVHYEIIHNHTQRRKRWISDAQNKKASQKQLLLKDFHVLIKEYKDGSKNLTQIDNLTEEFEKLYKLKLEQTNISLFEKRAFQTTYNYMKNNSFSLLLTNRNIDQARVAAEYDIIKNIQSATSIKNYFPSLKYSNYLCSTLESLLKDNNIDVQLIESNILKLENVLKDTYEGYEWSKDKNFLAFQLPPSECMINYTERDTEYNFFIASSFVLPLNYEKILIELKELNRKLEKFKTLLEVHINLDLEKNSIKEIRENIEKSDRRSIEILGVFSAIVLFTSSSIQIFSIKDIHFKDALKFMLCFSYSLTLFIFLVWLITRENIKSVTKIHKAFFISLAFVALISILFTLNWWPFNK